MRIFVVGTGRCGSTTFAKAASHAENFTSGHETRGGSMHDFEYPDNHIEVDPPLSFVIPQIWRQYPDAKFVHLFRRNRQACLESIAHNDPEVATSFANMIWHDFAPHAPYGAGLLYDAINDLCEALLPNAFRLPLEDAGDVWADCWEFMGCEGDFDASLEEWNVKHNATST